MSVTESHKESNGHKKWIIGAILTLVVILGSSLLLMPTVMLAVIAGNTASSSLNAGCYSNIQLASGTSGASADGVTENPTVGSSGYADEQLENARTIDQVAQNLGLSGQASVVAITAAMGESSLFNLNYGDENQGVTNADGTPTTSKGLFQQQTSMGWGTVEQVTNPEYAATSFYLGMQHNGVGSGLVSVNGWESMEVTQAIHKVQSNADATHYSRFYSQANEVMDIIGLDRNRPADESKQDTWKSTETIDSQVDSSTSSPIAHAFNDCRNTNNSAGNSSVVAGKEAQNTYPWGEYGDGGPVPPPGVYTADPMGFYYGECTSFVSWKLNENMGGTADNIIFNNSYGGVRKGNGAEWKSAWETLGWEVSTTPVPGAVAWWGANGGEGIGSAGHVAIVADVTDDGKVIIEEYNNAYYASPGHKYNVRPQPVDPSDVNAFLYPPPQA